MAFSGVLPSSPFQLSTQRRTFLRTVRCTSSQTIQRQFDLKTYWKTLVGEINQKLDEAIQIRYPERIYESMRYSVLAKGAKRAPPVMCVAACELFGGDREAAFPTACALEMVRFGFNLRFDFVGLCPSSFNLVIVYDIGEANWCSIKLDA